MMFGDIILICIPAATAAVGALCSRRDLKALFCIFFFSAVFCITGCGLFRGYGLPPVRDTSPAYMLIMYICSALTDDPSVFTAVTAGLQSAVAAAAVFTVCTSPYEGAVMITGCFVLTTFLSPTLFTAGMICTAAAKYIREGRTVRFTALILAAACFDSSALLLIPLYFIAMIPNIYICAGISAAAAVLAALFPGAVGGILDFIGGGTSTGFAVPIPCAVIVGVFALLCVLMRAMLINRSADLGRLANTAVTGAALTAGAAAAPVLSAAALFTVMQAVTALAPEMYAIGGKFVEIVFKDSKKAARITFGTVCAAAVIGVCAYLVLSDAAGSGFFAAAVTGEAGL